VLGYDKHAHVTFQCSDIDDSVDIVHYYGNGDEVEIIEMPLCHQILRGVFCLMSSIRWKEYIFLMMPVFGGGLKYSCMLLNLLICCRRCRCDRVIPIPFEYE